MGCVDDVVNVSGYRISIGEVELVFIFYKLCVEIVVVVFDYDVCLIN